MDHIGTLRLSVEYVEDDARFLLVHPLATCGARIQIQKGNGMVRSLDPEYVAVSADKQVGPFQPKLLPNPGKPSAGPSTDVRHPDSNPPQGAFKVLTDDLPHCGSVYVSENRHRRRNRLELIEDVDGAQISRVENAVDVAESLGDRRVEVSVCVGDDADSQGAGCLETHRAKTTEASVEGRG